MLVFVEDFPSLPRIVYLLDVSSALPRLQKLLTAQGNLIAAFRQRCSGVILQTSSMNLLVVVVISLFSCYLLVQPFPTSFILLSVFYQIMHF